MIEINGMKDLYKYFGEEKEEGQELYSIANIFYEMGKKEDEKNKKRQELIEDDNIPF